MAGNLDSSTKDALIKFIISELARPTTNQVHDCFKSELLSGPQHVVAALLASGVLESSAHNQVERPVATEVYDSLLKYADNDFQNMFRLKRSTIQDLVPIVEMLFKSYAESDHPSVSVEKKVLLTCWLLGNTKSFEEASFVFGLSETSVYQILYQVCTALTKVAGKYICWPSPEECSVITEAFEDKYGFPGVIGVIGSCHIKIKEPEQKEEAIKFLNTESCQHTIILQAVCDDKMVFRDVCVGYPGKSTSSEVLAGSPLYDRLTSKTNPLIEPHKHILGTSDYPQLATLLTPYCHEASGRPLTEQEHKFNRLHKTATDTIQQSFTLLEERFCRLQFVNVDRTELASQVTITACILHNFAILHGDEFNVHQNMEEAVLVETDSQIQHN